MSDDKRDVVFNMIMEFKAAIERLLDVMQELTATSMMGGDMETAFIHIKMADDLNQYIDKLAERGKRKAKDADPELVKEFDNWARAKLEKVEKESV